MQFSDFGRYKCKAENIDRARTSKVADLSQNSDICKYLHRISAGADPGFDQEGGPRSGTMKFADVAKRAPLWPGVWGPLKGPRSFGVFSVQICILPLSRHPFLVILCIKLHPQNLKKQFIFTSVKLYFSTHFLFTLQLLHI